MTIWRWTSTGSSFSLASAWHSGAFPISRVGDRVAVGDVDNDGDDDIVMAYQNPNGTFSFYVFKNGGSSTAQIWYTSGAFSLTPVGGRLVVGDVNGDGKADAILARDSGNGTVVLWRWYSTGSAFPSYSTATYSNLPMSSVDDRVAIGDVNGNGMADTVMAFQNTDGTFAFKVFPNGTGAPVNWYTSGPFSLAPVANRLVLGNWG
jgi:hypothetical protein